MGETKKGHGNLTLWICVAILLAIGLALIAPHVALKFHVGGEIFLRLLQMVVVPLVMASVMSGILGLGDVRKLGKPGFYAISYYFCTTIFAVVTGLIVVNIVNPGKGIDRKLVEDARSEGEQTVAHAAGKDERKIAWHNVTGDRSEVSGESKNIPVPAEGSWNVKVIIDQVGEATVPAKAIVKWSRDGNSFVPIQRKHLEQETDAEAPAIGEFHGQKKPGIYRTASPVPVPEGARYVRIEFVEQQGGERSIIEAFIIPGPPTIADIVQNLMLMLFTANLLESMVEINLLPLIIFSIVFAGLLTTMGRKSETINSLVVSINDALMTFILFLMQFAPLGIFCLVAARFGKAQLDGQFLQLIKTQAWYMTSVLGGLAVHGLVTLPLLLWLFTRRNPFQFMRQMSQAVLTAFSTASSTATLPVSMECAEVNAGVSRRSTEFVLPLGATINMDGTALYEAAAAIFIAQAYAIIDPSFVLTLDKQIVIALTATLAAIGAAGIPEAGLVTMLIVLNAVGLPLELIGLILPIDWLLDRFRTSVNAFGDSVGAAIVDGVMPQDGDGGAMPENLPTQSD
ncbi:MAG: dicarboxylate/amino acid:cation symporter [Planctomycetota bacterium]|nr:dicarboxylate/amino acid:cation symporter [Planctomycetota bacterium]